MASTRWLRGAVEPLQRRREAEQPERRHVAVGGRAFGQVADAPARLDRRRGEIEPAHETRPLLGAR